MMQLVFTGTLYTGKSSLVRELAQRLSMKAIIDFRPEFGLPGTRDFCDSLDSELEEALDEACIIDRYWTDRMSFEHLFDHHPECVVRLAQELEKPVPLFRHIFFVDPELEYQKDMQRLDREQYIGKRLELSYNIANLLQIYDIPHTVLTGTFEQRVMKVLHVLELESTGGSIV